MMIFTGRFQPFHIGHLCVVRKLVEWATEEIVLGIIAPDPERHFPGDEKNWVRFTRDKNPLSYWERLEVVNHSLADLRSRVAAIVPLPRPSVNIHRANNYLPARPRTFVLCQKWGDEVEQWKAEAYKKHGEQLQYVDFNQLGPLAQLASGELIRSLMRIGNPAWKLFVAPTATGLFENKTLWHKLTAELTTEKARDYLNGFFANERLGSVLKQLLDSKQASLLTPDKAGHTSVSLEDGLSLLAKLSDRILSSPGSQINIQHLIYMQDNYSAGQVIGAFGKNVSLRDVNVQQLAQDLNSSGRLEALAEELDQLRLDLKKRAINSDHDVVVGEIASAHECAKKGDGVSLVGHLRKAGSWALEVAKEIGKSVAVEAIKKSCGL